jgi:acetyl esterase/lipase
MNMSLETDHIRRVIPTLGRNVSPVNAAAVRELYKPIMRDADRDVLVHRDVAYGDDARHKLDICRKNSSETRPIFLYVPGGGFVGGDKNVDDTFYANIGSWAAQAGMVGVTMNYRLAPQNRWPDAATDIAAAVGWLKANARNYNGDADRIFVFGHSAGAAHVATYLFDPDIRGDTQVRAAWLSSGIYEVPDDETRSNVLAYYGSDTGEFARRSSINFVEHSNIPVGISVAEYDPPEFVTPSFDLAKLVCLRDRACPKVIVLEGHNHFSGVASLGSSDESVAEYLLKFVQENVDCRMSRHV